MFDFYLGPVYDVLSEKINNMTDKKIIKDKWNMVFKLMMYTSLEKELFTKDELAMFCYIYENENYFATNSKIYQKLLDSYNWCQKFVTHVLTEEKLDNKYISEENIKKLKSMKMFLRCVIYDTPWDYEVPDITLTNANYELIKNYKNVSEIIIEGLKNNYPYSLVINKINLYLGFKKESEQAMSYMRIANRKRTLGQNETMRKYIIDDLMKNPENVKNYSKEYLLNTKEELIELSMINENIDEQIKELETINVINKNLLERKK